MDKILLVVLLLVGVFTFAQETVTCQFDENFAEENYFYSSNINEKLKSRQLKKKLVSRIFSLIKTESSLELTNEDGQSTSKFIQQSMVKSRAFLINPELCKKKDGGLVVFVNKNQFNTSFLTSYRSDIVLLKNRIKDLQSSELSRASKFLKEDIVSVKKEFERLKFFLPFANSISESNYDRQIQDLYKSLTELEIFSLSVDDRILKIEQNWINMECKEALQRVSSISSVELSRRQSKRLKKVRKNIEQACKRDYKKDLKLAKEESSLFNNLEFSLYLQSYPMNTSSDIPNSNEFSLETPFITGRLNYFLGVSNSGLRIGPYFRYFYLGGSLGEIDKTLEFSDSFSDAGLSVRYRFIKDYLQFEISGGRSINEITPTANSNLEPFNFIVISTGLILGSSKGISFSAGLDYFASDEPSNYKYLTAKLGVNYSIPFNKISKNERNNIKGKYEIKN
jgi:hypothetical protein